MNIRKLWFGFTAVMVLSFGVLGYFGIEIYHQAPPIPDKVVTADGTVLFTGQDIRDGQNVWQSIGGQELGSVWGHGAYQAPDWTADWLHKEAIAMLDVLSIEKFSKKFTEIDPADQAFLKIKLQQDIRKNTYSESAKTITVSATRASAIQSTSTFYSGLFTNNPEMAKLRESYSIPENSIKSQDRIEKMVAFFWWASWACVTERPEVN